MKKEKSLREQIDDTLIELMSYGLTLEEAREMDYQEALMYVEAFKRKNRRQKIEQAQLHYILAQLIATNVGCFLAKGCKPLSFKEAYKTIFEDDEEDMDTRRQKQTEQDECNFLEFAAMVNSRGVE